MIYARFHIHDDQRVLLTEFNIFNTNIHTYTHTCWWSIVEDGSIARAGVKHDPESYRWLSYRQWVIIRHHKFYMNYVNI